MKETILILNQVLPILFLIAIGFWIRQKNFLRETTIDDLRKIVVNLALPAVLFVSFLSIELKPAYLVIFIIIFSLCVLLFLWGKFIGRRNKVEHTYYPFLSTGFEYGMLGLSLFGAAYGLENIGYIAVVDLGHEIFIWFVFLPLLLIRRDGVQDPRGIARSFLSSPVVIAILTSICINLLGGGQLLYDLPLTGALMNLFGFLGGLTVPLILIIVGYGININRSGISDAARVVLIRLVFLIPLAFVLNTFVIRGFLHLDKMFEAALFTLLILPPPFIIPLYARSDLREDEKQYINNVLTLHTVVSISIFIIYFAANPLI